MEKNVLHYFVDTNSSRGFVSFWESNFGKLEKVVKLDGYPDLLVTQLVSQACAQALGCEQEVELVHNCLDNSLQGIILPGQKTGLLNLPAYGDESYSLRLAEDENLSKARERVQRAYGCFGQALKIHDDWKKPPRSFSAGKRQTAPAAVQTGSSARPPSTALMIIFPILPRKFPSGISSRAARERESPPS